MSLKRHPALQPFSRDHVVGLFHAHQLMWLSEGRARFDASSTVAHFSDSWREEIEQHFADEERLLGKLRIEPESIERLFREHNEFRALVSELFGAAVPDIGQCLQTGSKLEQHIRWEEHEFFPEIEHSLSESELQELQRQTLKIDKTRHRSV